MKAATEKRRVLASQALLKGGTVRSKLALSFAVGVLAATAVWAGYLHHRIKQEVTISWDQGLQDRERTLREVRALEQLLQDGQVADATVELQRIRQRTLSNLAAFMSNPSAEGVRVGALRVFCSEIPVELPLPRNSGEELGQRRILATQPFCDRDPG
jgi:hypothetical protein